LFEGGSAQRCGEYLLSFAIKCSKI